MITLWGRSSSINVQKVLWTFGELGLACEHINAGGDAGGLDDPAFRAMNPHGRIPVLRDGETVVWESNTIVRYLCATYSPAVLCPISAARRAEAEAWMDWELASLQPAAIGLFWSFYRTPQARRDEVAIQALADAAAQRVAVLDQWLQQRPFVAGDEFTMADIPAGTLMHRYFGMGFPTPAAPHVEAWRGRLAERAPYQDGVMQPFDELFGRSAY
jgi:glutathione S-transferase